MTLRKTIPVAGPSITQAEIDAVTEAVTRCWYDGANEFHQKFEDAFADYIGCRYAVSLPSCTSGLHLALAAMGVGPGDEVIVPDVTWIASAAPISYVGATPVFCDIDEKTWCLDPVSVESCITEKTAAIIGVDLYGSMADWSKLEAIAKRHGLGLIEDAAEALGSELNGARAGSFGDVGVFSFHGSKTLTTGEGGMLVTNDEKLFSRVCFLRDHGRVPGDVSFQNREVAFKYKMSSMQAALGYAQLQRVDELVDKKREIFYAYREALGGRDELTLNAEPEGVKNSFWMSSVIVGKEVDYPKLSLMADLKEKHGVDSRPFFSPLSSLDAYKELARQEGSPREKRPVSYRVSGQGLNLPSALSIGAEEIEMVTQSLVDLLDARG